MNFVMDLMKTKKLTCVSWVLIFPVLVGFLGALAATDKRIGTQPPAWQVTNWINSASMDLKDLRGKVVLVRWWTAPDCPYCRASAPALNEFFDAYHSRGLEVLGFYHHKSDKALDPKLVRKYVKEYGFKFPVATDPEWRTLRRWWLDGDDQKWTSVSFLIDRGGVIRYIHPGGQYVKGDEDYAVLKQKIEQVLAATP